MLGGAFSQFSVFGNDAQCFLALEGLPAVFVPAHVELALELVDQLLGRLVRCVGCGRCKIGEPGFAGLDRLGILQPLYGLVRQVDADVIVR